MGEAKRRKALEPTSRPSPVKGRASTAWTSIGMPRCWG